ncbi:hypothetical protein MHLP_01975 [Candidatus Mycoplasma haematolamae str. Purdue]|uniref:Uncharacterized protein n=1 Tax=Mycoplasma haematolamae (strain Purdue) TaxID=1212765 RepID=I7B9P6_MYCHA|nr:hypothetical protein [Candidatus Mycoplasma haematolamae]AFO51975.1 hypothetical protein MHLP_01975 [Candidatus Mycoplasma haematolamae str. Purdue]
MALPLKTICLSLAGVGSTIGGGFGMDYVVRKSVDLTKTKDSTDSVASTGTSEDVSVSTVSSEQEEPDSTVTDVSAEDSFDWEKDTDDDEGDEGEADLESKVNQFSGTLYLTKELDLEWGAGDEHFYKLALKGSDISENQQLSIEVTSTKTEKEIEAFLTIFNGEASVFSDNLGDVLKTLRGNQSKFESFFNKDVFSALMTKLEDLKN